MNGQLSSSINYEKGQLHGLYQDWYENRQMLQKTTYDDGKLQGTYRRWHENGRLNFEICYVDGEETKKKLPQVIQQTPRIQGQRPASCTPKHYSTLRRVYDYSFLRIFSNCVFVRSLRNNQKAFSDVSTSAIRHLQGVVCPPRISRVFLFIEVL